MSDKLHLIMKILPESIKKPLRKIRIKVKRLTEFPAICIQPYRHKRALERLRVKSVNHKVRVAFFATHSAVWKYDGVYQLINNDPRFEPIVVVCPIVNYGKENMLIEMEKTYNLFQNKGYNVIKTYDEGNDTYLDVKEEIRPDIIFYTNPYRGLIMEDYYIANFKDTLTCYVQYAFQVSNVESVDQVNLYFHNVLWKFFLETKIHSDISKKYARNKGINTIVTGYPVTDFLIYGCRTDGNVWKNTDQNLKRIIWAPHHTIEKYGQLNLSNFFLYYQLMINFTQKYQEKIQIAFKPHPLLKTKLYEHKDWGKRRTDSYYSRWENCKNGQLEVDEYIDLFNSSDALIHDSGSFMGEYLYCGKPVLYTMLNDDIRCRFNDFGNKALDRHYHAYNATDIMNFIENVVINELDKKRDERDEFYFQNLIIPNNVTASENIYNCICKEIFMR